MNSSLLTNFIIFTNIIFPYCSNRTWSKFFSFDNNYPIIVFQVLFWACNYVPYIGSDLLYCWYIPKNDKFYERHNIPVGKTYLSTTISNIVALFKTLTTRTIKLFIPSIWARLNEPKVLTFANTCICPWLCQIYILGTPFFISVTIVALLVLYLNL